MQKRGVRREVLYYRSVCLLLIKGARVPSLVGWLLLATNVMAADDKPTPGVTPTLVRGEINENSQSIPVVGVEFKVESPWHVYWWYAGKLGRPTTLKAKLGSGSLVSALWWEVPNKFRAEGVGETYGYDTDTVIGIEFGEVLEKGFKDEDTVSVALSWAACNPEVCVPGRKTLESKYGVLREVSFAKVLPLRISRPNSELDIRANFTVENDGGPNTDWRLVGLLSGVPVGTKVLEWLPSGGTIDPRLTKIETRGDKIYLVAEGQGELVRQDQGTQDQNSKQIKLPLVVVLAKEATLDKERIYMVVSDGVVDLSGAGGN